MACPFASKEKQQKGIYKNTTKRALRFRRGSNVFSEKNKTDNPQIIYAPKNVNPKSET
jgi:hypothetical protein